MIVLRCFGFELLCRGWDGQVGKRVSKETPKSDLDLGLRVCQQLEDYFYISLRAATNCFDYSKV